METAPMFLPSKRFFAPWNGKHGKARRVWVFDRGLVTEENLVAVRKRAGGSIWWAPHHDHAIF
jgi:hypothetical protein